MHFRVELLLRFLICGLGVFSGSTSTNDGQTAKETVPSGATTPFHLAIPVHDVQAAREFFGGYHFDAEFEVFLLILQCLSPMNTTKFYVFQTFLKISMPLLIYGQSVT